MSLKFKDSAKNFMDGLHSMFSALVNKRNALNNNEEVSSFMQYDEMKAMYKSGIGNKIISLKTDHSLRDSIQFKDDAEEEFFKTSLAEKVKEAVTYMLAYGRGVIAIVEINGDMSTPLARDFYDKKYRLEVFSGDMVAQQGASPDLMDEFYERPRYYSIRGVLFHHSRIIDFSYIKPPKEEAAIYQFGGMSEFEIIRNQLVSNGIVERASASILEKNSSIFYKVEGLRDSMAGNNEAAAIRYFGSVENNRGIHGATVLDGQDEAFVLNQSLTDLDKVDMVTLRRLAMVTNIPLTWLVGESAQGLNSTGDNETDIFFWMISNIRFHYEEKPINILLKKFNRPQIEFKKKSDLTAEKQVEFDAKIIDNATKLDAIGEDSRSYLVENGVTLEDDLAKSFFSPPDNDGPELIEGDPQRLFLGAPEK